jgi:hypothetical protein
MSVGAIGGVEGISQSRIEAAAPEKKTESFKEVLSNLNEKIAWDRVFGVADHKALGDFRQRVTRGAHFTNQELLSFQIRAGEFGLRVELISKLADSLVGTAKKFEQGS